MEQGKLKELLEFQISRNITNLYKSFLIMVEDLHQQHHSNYKKLKQSLPEKNELINQADYWDEERMDFVRKKILDNGNGTLREIMSQLEQFDITIK